MVYGPRRTFPNVWSLHPTEYSSEIEGIRLNVDQVRSSIARKLGINQFNKYCLYIVANN